MSENVITPTSATAMASVHRVKKPHLTKNKIPALVDFCRAALEFLLVEATEVLEQKVKQKKDATSPKIFRL